MFNLRHISLERLTALTVAGDTVLESMRVLGRTGDSIVGEMLKGNGEFRVWDHYPRSDVIDPHSHSQFYYHAHPKAQRPGEHGHFHLFVRAEGIPKTIKPARIGRKNKLSDFDNPMCHLFAVSMNTKSMPIAIFTTNRWVTNDPWYSAEDTIQLLDYFIMDMAHPSWPVNRWVTAMVQLFRPQIERLLLVRDRKVSRLRRQNPTREIFSSDRLEIISHCKISLKNQIRLISKEFGRRRRQDPHRALS